MTHSLSKANDTTTRERHVPTTKLSPHFFRRERDGSVKLRMNLSPEEATLIEEAAGSTPLMLYIHRVLLDRAKFHIERTNRAAPDDSTVEENDFSTIITEEP